MKGQKKDMNGTTMPSCTLALVISSIRPFYIQVNTHRFYRYVHQHSVL